MKTLEEVREDFSKDRFATDNGAVIDKIAKDYAMCSLDIKECHKNALGAVMGGVYFTLADFTFAVASNWEKPGTVSLDSTISYLSPAKGSKLIAQAHCKRNGRTTCNYTIDVTDDLGNLVATVTITGYHVN